MRFQLKSHDEKVYEESNRIREEIRARHYQPGAETYVDELLDMIADLRVRVRDLEDKRREP